MLELVIIQVATGEEFKKFFPKCDDSVLSKISGICFSGFEGISGLYIRYGQVAEKVNELIKKNKLPASIRKQMHYDPKECDRLLKVEGNSYSGAYGTIN